MLYLARCIASKPASAPVAAATAAAPVVVVAAKVEEPTQQSVQKVQPLSDDEDGDRAGGQGDIQPVGHDYVEEVTRNEKKNDHKQASVITDQHIRGMILWLTSKFKKKYQLRHITEEKMVQCRLETVLLS